MAIYSVKNSKSILENYIDNEFLESVLNQEAIEIRSQINESLRDDFEKTSEVLESISNSSLHNSTKELLNKAVKEAYTGVSLAPVCEDTAGLIDIEECVLLEYSGNDRKNQEFIEVLKEVEELCSHFIDRMENLDKHLSNILSLVESTKNEKQMKAAHDKAMSEIKAYNEWYDKAVKKVDGQITWRRFTKLVGKFNNKYSQVTMEEKKKLREKLFAFAKRMDAAVDPWAKGGAKIRKAIDIADSFKAIDKVYAEKILGIIDSGVNVLINEANYTIKDINYVLNSMKINATEKSLMYKIINKIL